MDAISLHIVWTLFIFIGFIGIIAWAYSSKRKSRFEEDANLIFADEQPKQEQEPSSEKGAEK